ncbi:MAG: hypothetical protein RJA22_1353 [Verrucomicrobiota bacterium]
MERDSRPLLAALLGACLVAGLTHAPAAPATPVPPLALRLVAEGFVSPLTALTLDDGSGRMLVGDQAGTVRILNRDGSLDPDLFLDLRPRMLPLKQAFDECGLLGLALHPRFRQNRLLYVYYSAARREATPAKWDHTSHISRFQVSEDFRRVDLVSEKVLLQVDQPQRNHNGGRLLFGPDGCLYVGLGDGGGAHDGGTPSQPAIGHEGPGNGQNTEVLLGKILRLDVDAREPYGIPRDNPFADGKGGKPEIYAWGFRNPWGLSFDRGGTRQFFVADVGQNLFEEVNIVERGGNYGWRLREAFVGFSPASPDQSPAQAPTVDAAGRSFRDPILTYGRPPKNKPVPTDVPCGISITGGYIYRGRAIPALQGRYVFGDWSRSWAVPDGVLLMAAPGEAGGRWRVDFLPMARTGEEPFKLGAYLVSFGEDAEGELYVMTTSRNGLHGTGKVYKLVQP